VSLHRCHYTHTHTYTYTQRPVFQHCGHCGQRKCLLVFVASSFTVYLQPAVPLVPCAACFRHAVRQWVVGEDGCPPQVVGLRDRTRGVQDNASHPFAIEGPEIKHQEPSLGAVSPVVL
jgi:hypothetical protein